MSSGGGSMFPRCDRDEVEGSSYSVSIACSELDPSCDPRVVMSELSPVISVVDVNGEYTW